MTTSKGAEFLALAFVLNTLALLAEMWIVHTVTGSYPQLWLVLVLGAVNVAAVVTGVYLGTRINHRRALRR